jgi:hypothetical protein
VFENRVLRRISGAKRDEVTGEWRKLHSEELVFCTHPQILLGRSNQGELGGRDMLHAWERRGKCTWFWSERQKERDHSEDQDVGGKMESEWILGRLAYGG